MTDKTNCEDTNMSFLCTSIEQYPACIEELELLHLPLVCIFEQEAQSVQEAKPNIYVRLTTLSSYTAMRISEIRIIRMKSEFELRKQRMLCLHG